MMSSGSDLAQLDQLLVRPYLTRPEQEHHLRPFREQAAQVERPVHIEEGVQERVAVETRFEYPMADPVITLLKPQDQMPVIAQKPVEAANERTLFNLFCLHLWLPLSRRT